MNPKLLKHVRQICGYTQLQLAEKVGVHQTLIGKLEQGETPINPATESKLKEIFASKGIRETEMGLLMNIFNARERSGGR